MLRDPATAGATARERALAGLASVVTEAPWTVDAGDLGRLSAAGLRDDEIVQAVSIAAVFNHLTRVADATGIEPDYTTSLPRLAVDVAREPLPRPDPGAWPRPAPRLPLSLRPATEAAVAAWRAYAFAPSAGLSARERTLAARVAAFHTADAAGVAAHAGATPESPREAALAAFAERLTLAPWRVAPADLDALRAHGCDDRALLDLIATIGFQNMDSRLTLALGA